MLATLPVVVVAEAATPVSLSPTRWLGFAVTLVAGSVPFALLGVAIGYAVEPRAAVPIANLVYLGLSYGGGLFQDASSLPGVLRPISNVFPTRLWADLLRASGAGDALPWENALGLAGYGVAFFFLAYWGFQRDEGKIYR